MLWYICNAQTGKKRTLTSNTTGETKAFTWCQLRVSSAKKRERKREVVRKQESEKVIELDGAW